MCYQRCYKQQRPCRRSVIKAGKTNVKPLSYQQTGTTTTDAAGGGDATAVIVQQGVEKTAFLKFNKKIVRFATYHNTIDDDISDHTMLVTATTPPSAIDTAPDFATCGGYDNENKKQMCSPFWYNSKDYHRFYKERDATVEAFQKVEGEAECLDPDQYCLRGLENYIFPSIRLQSKIVIHEVIRSVLDNQRLYARSGMSCAAMASTLGALSRIGSAPSLEKALALASVDQQAAETAQGQEQDKQEKEEKKGETTQICVKEDSMDCSPP